MRPEQRLAGVFATASFLGITMIGYVATDNAVHALLYGIGAALVMGVIGHHMAFIIAHPQGNKKNKGRNTRHANASSHSGDSKPLTGEETFLDDVGG